MLLAGSQDKLQDWLDRTAVRHPEKALDIWVRISERFMPSLQRTEITGAEGLPFSPITINLPNIPKISLGEPTATSLLTSPAEEIKALGEGSSTGLSGMPMFLSQPLPVREGSSAEHTGEHSVGAPSQDHPGDLGDGGLD